MDSIIESFRSYFDNYKSGARKVPEVYPKKCNVYQEQFHLHVNSEGRNGMEAGRLLSLIRLKMF